jgi:chromosomal replication initiation ATPase DnaA
MEITKIIEAATRELGVDRADLPRNKRAESIVLARETIAYLARERTQLSYPAIAVAIGKKTTDNSSVFNAEKRMRKRLADPKDTVRDGKHAGRTVSEVVKQIESALGD